MKNSRVSRWLALWSRGLQSSVNDAITLFPRDRRPRNSGEKHTSFDVPQQENAKRVIHTPSVPSRGRLMEEASPVLVLWHTPCIPSKASRADAKHIRPVAQSQSFLFPFLLVQEVSDEQASTQLL